MGCDLADEPEVDHLAVDNQRCADLGFAAGTTGMAECMRTASETRNAKLAGKAREDEHFQQQMALERAERERKEERQKRKKKKRNSA